MGSQSYILLLLSVVVVGINCDCMTWENLPCIIPYRLDGNLHTECTGRLWPTSSSDTRVIPMCPTSLSSNGEGLDWGRCNKECPLASYRSNTQMYDEILSLSQSHPSLASPFIIGESELKNPLVGIRISRGVRRPRESLKPMVRLVGNIHGNEAVGREIIITFARHLLLGYGLEPRLTRLIDTTDISLVPSINPDGFSRAAEGKCSGTGKDAGMYSEGGVDLNRDFPTVEDHDRFQNDYNYDPYVGRQPETQAVMKWTVEEPWVLAAGLHDGAVMVTYPWDRPSSSPGQEHTTPDIELFLHLSKGYVDTHPEMANSSCYRSVEGGMVNGALWNNRNRRGAVGGSMKDFSYIFSNCLQISLELSCCKYPVPHFLLREWEHNRESLLGLLEQVHMGVKGLVFNEKGSPQENADIITWRPDGSRWLKNVTTGINGEYWRMLLPNRAGKNTYTLQAWFSDCEPGGSGRVFASLRHRVIVSPKNPLKEQHMYLTQVGYCGITEQSNSPASLIQELLRQPEQPRSRPGKSSSISDLGSLPIELSKSRSGLRNSVQESLSTKTEEPRSRVRNSGRESSSVIEELIGNLFVEEVNEVEIGRRQEEKNGAVTGVLNILDGL